MLDLTQPITSKAHETQPMPADRVSSPTRPRGVHTEGIEETDAREDWLHAVTADPAFWLKEVGC